MWRLRVQAGLELRRSRQRHGRLGWRSRWCCRRQCGRCGRCGRRRCRRFRVGGRGGAHCAWQGRGQHGRRLSCAFVLLPCAVWRLRRGLGIVGGPFRSFQRVRSHILASHVELLRDNAAPEGRKCRTSKESQDSQREIQQKHTSPSILRHRFRRPRRSRSTETASMKAHFGDLQARCQRAGKTEAKLETSLESSLEIQSPCWSMRLCSQDDWGSAAYMWYGVVWSWCPAGRLQNGSHQNANH